MTRNISNLYYSKDDQTIFFLVNESPHLVDPHQTPMDSDTRLLNLSPVRLSPNLFLNLNFDHGNTMDNSNALKFEWTNFNPNPVFNKQNPSMNNLHHLDNTSSPSLPYEFLNGDHFNIENFRNECILNLDQNLLNHVDSGDQMMSRQMCQEDKLAINMDLQNYSMQDSKSSELLDLEKPININVINLSNEKY